MEIKSQEEINTYWRGESAGYHTGWQGEIFNTKVPVFILEGAFWEGFLYGTDRYKKDLKEIENG